MQQWLVAFSFAKNQCFLIFALLFLILCDFCLILSTLIEPYFPTSIHQHRQASHMYISFNFVPFLLETWNTRSNSFLFPQEKLQFDCHATNERISNSVLEHEPSNYRVIRLVDTNSLFMFVNNLRHQLDTWILIGFFKTKIH